MKQPALTLKQFMLRQEVLRLYRDIFRTIRRVPQPENRLELQEWARRDFRSNRHHTDETSIKMMLQYGRRCLTELQNSLDLSGNR
ncbi:LYR motif-containing protein 2 [Phlebotomus papatasi]|uniref:LYR motif-containing protein 2 n=1 Tax=Phlebotomus papatasi TaxID=29031 RepID=UPI0024840A47|nr:LYR motif-containing protein 2 [Phlebotomus papatasi]